MKTVVVVLGLAVLVVLALGALTWLVVYGPGISTPTPHRVFTTSLRGSSE